MGHLIMTMAVNTSYTELDDSRSGHSRGIIGAPKNIKMGHVMWSHTL